uniref:Uncharacterized protein n=1 Tax=viral metagenome TaxID=1070528 RepID=A0A6C0HYE5_9ZZZZ
MSAFEINQDKFIGDMKQTIMAHYKENILLISDPRFHDIMIGDVTGKIIQKYNFEGHNFEVLRELVEEEHNEVFDNTYCYIKRTYDHYIGNAYRVEFGQDEDWASIYVSKKMETIKEVAQFNMKNKWIYTVGKMLYENETGAKIGESGRIQHPHIPSIICEFDGIVENMESPLYGRIIEINNVQKKYNIGIPYEEEWIKLQMQMECCDLEFCDYVETQIKEYETEEEFFADEERTKGLILILEKNGESVYKYMPLTIGTEIKEIKAWMEETYNDEYKYVNTIYWYLENYEISLVIRNHDWFNKSNVF